MRSVLLFSLLCLSHFANALQADYTVRISNALDEMLVRVCFSDGVPDALHNGAYRRNQWLKTATGPDGQQLSVRRNRMSLSGIKVGQCIDYQVALTENKQRRRSLYRAGDDLILNNRVWLWQPKGLVSTDVVRLQFELPKGYATSTPWPTTGKPHQVKLTATPYDWTSRIAIGKFTVTPVAIGDRHIQVAVLNSSAKRKAEYIDWLKQAAEAVAGINGQYPVDNAQVVIVPIGASREAVPWGEVQRGGSVAAHFFVDSFRPIQEFKDDWTATHELSHMLVPYIDRDELWLSEGIASYYQNVARGKAGMISHEMAWDKLLAGFGRGTRAAKKESLSNSSAIMQMYWGGAAIYLMADAELRKRSGGKQSLATVLKKFNGCCRPSIQSWSGVALMKQWDQLSGTRIFTTLYYEQAQARRFPDVEPLLRALGFNGLKRDKTKALEVAAKALVD